MKKYRIVLVTLMSCFVMARAQETAQRSVGAEALLQSLRQIEGVKTLSGTIANVNWNLNEAEWVYQHTGKWPALNYFDYIHAPYSQKGGWIDYTDVTEVVNWHKQGGVVGIMWHWNVRTNDGKSYTCTPGKGSDQTSFDVRKIFEPSSDEYKQMIKDIDQIASYLKLLKLRGIPVLWRPLHESGGMWFWWGMDADACNELWRLMYRRFQQAGLNNLIWVWTSAAAWNKPYSDGYKWYPGDEYVDIVGIDVYNNTSASDIYTKCYNFLHRYSPDKMVALTEFGNVAKISAQWKAGSKWLFFMPWYDYDRTKDPSSAAFKSTDHGHANAEWWKDAFACDFVLTREDFRELRTSIRDVRAAERLAAPSSSYDLMGRPWTAGSRGIMIHNGKKYLKK